MIKFARKIRYARMEEIRIDCAKFSEEEIKEAIITEQTLFKFNNTMPFTPEYEELLKTLFPHLGENCKVVSPLKGVRFWKVKFGKNVYVNAGCLMMAAGGIFLDDGAMLAANVQIISNNHDLYQRSVITCKPVHIGKNVWVGAGATILPGVTIGDNAVVGAGSVVTKSVEPWTIVAGNPAKVIRKIEPKLG